MKYRILGHSGYRVSEIGLGCWQLGGDFGPLDDTQSKRILDEALTQHINLYDTADVYGGGLSEQRISQWKRSKDKDVTVITKVGRNADLYPDGYTKEKVRASLEGSAKRLETSCIDLAQLHCVPFNVLKDGDIFNWMEEFKQEGLIRHYGASVETIEQALHCIDNSNITSLQIIFNLFRQDAVEQLFPKAQDKNVGIIVRLPLASGLLSGTMSTDRQFDESDHRNFNKNGEFFSVGETFSGIPFAKGVELSKQLKNMVPGEMALSQFALRWILDFPAVTTVIAGASRPQQVAENVLSSTLPKLDPNLKQRLADFYVQEVRPHIRGGI